MEAFKKIKGILLVVCAGILLTGGIFIILNIAGGIKVNKKRLLVALDEADFKDANIGSLTMKFGLVNEKLIARDLKIQKDNLTISADGFGIKKTFFSNNVSEIFLENGEVTMLLKEDESLKDAFLALYNTLPSKKTGKIISLSEITMSIVKSDTTFKIENINLKLEEKKAGTEIKGTFKIGNDLYTFMLAFPVGNNVNFRLESDNFALKMILNDNAGNVFVSINNITEFLNSVTPDTINIDLGYFDGNKNTIYFKSNISYNDIRKSMEFANSKIQFYGEAEKEIKIDTLSNNSYKVIIDFPEITINQIKEKKDFIWGETKTPVIQLGKIFPTIRLLLEARIGKISISDEKSPIEINELRLNSSFEAGKIAFDTSLLYNKKFSVGLEGFMQNFESPNRKGFIRTKIEGREVDLSNTILLNVIDYNGPKNSNFVLSFDTILSGDTMSMNKINLIGEGVANIVSSGIEYNLYKKQSDYLLELNAKNIELDKVKFLLPSSLTEKGQELFRTIFQYLSFKTFTYIDFTCTDCKAGNEQFDIIKMQYSLTPGKIEIEKLDLISPNLQASINGILDIRDASASTLNLDVFIKKWKDFSFPKLFSISEIFKNEKDFQIPSLQSFSGVINVEGVNIESAENKIRDIGMLFSLNRGFLKSVSSEITLNGNYTKDFIKTDSSFYGNIPSINLSLALSGIKVKEIIGYFLKDDKFDKIDGTASIGFSTKTTGFLLKDLIKNAFSSMEMKSGDLTIKNFNIDALSLFMRQGKGGKFKNLENKEELQDKLKSDGLFSLVSNWRINGQEANLESMELNSLASDIPSKIFVVGKYSPSYLVMKANTTTPAANVNKNLEGGMPINLSTFITKQGEKLQTDIDYSQVNKYYQVRKVIDK